MPLHLPDTWGVKKNWSKGKDKSVQSNKSRCYWWEKYPLGTRVKLKRGVDRFPSFGLVEAGKKGTVIQNTRDEIYIKMDDHIEDAEEWDNCIIWYIDDFGEDMLGNPVNPLQELDDDVEIIGKVKV